MPKPRLTAQELVKIIERTRTGDGPLPVVADDIDEVWALAKDLSSKDLGVFERRMALRAIAAEIVKRILRRLDTDGDGVSVPLLDVSLRYLRFLADLDVHDQASDVHIDPVDMLCKLTGLSRDEILSLYHKSSVEKFREATLLHKKSQDEQEGEEDTTGDGGERSD
jgi:hypothetical protein